MASKFRNLIASKIRRQIMASGSLNQRLNPPPSLQDLEVKMRLVISPDPRLPFRISLKFPWEKDHTDNKKITASQTITSHIIENFDADKYVPSVIQIGHNVIAFDLPKNLFIQELLKVGITRDFGQYKWLRNGLFETGKNSPSTIIVEFSSPNVAKPFHMGHLRSTIIGNFVANIQEAVGHQVIRLNWLGDWGTQFGLIAHGLQNSELEQILNCQDPMNELYNVYVEVNKKAEQDENVATEARSLFAQLEAGNAQLKTQWSQIRTATVDSLEEVYSRLGIHFDHYHGEAMYGDQMTKDSVLNRLTESGLITIIEDGRQVIDLDSGHKRRVVITKSDGSSLYITRDISAGLDRLKSFDPDKII